MISPEMTVLDIVSKHPVSEQIFRTYDGQIGKCLLCQCLFHTLEALAVEYELDLGRLLQQLNEAATHESA